MPSIPPYTLELTFTGLCVFVFHGPDKRNPKEVNLLMVDTLHAAPSKLRQEHDACSHQHFPILSFQPGNLTANSDVPYKLVPAPDGTQIGQLDLRGEKKLELTPKGKSLTAVWRPPKEPARTTPNEKQAEWLNWVPSLDAAHFNLPLPKEADPLAGLDISHCITRLTLTKGKLTAGRIARRPNGKIVTWIFKTDDGREKARQAIAQTIVLTIEGLTSRIQLTGHSKGKFGLKPERDQTMVRASFTNLPQVESVPPGMTMKKLEHFTYFFDLFSQPLNSRDLALPEAEVIVDTSSGAICPNGHFTVIPT